MQLKILIMSTKQQATHSALPYCHLFGALKRANCFVSLLNSFSVAYAEAYTFGKLPMKTRECMHY